MVLDPKMEEPAQNGRRGRSRHSCTSRHADDPLGYFVLPILSILDSAELQGLIAQAGTLPGNGAKVPLS